MQKLQPFNQLSMNLLASKGLEMAQLISQLEPPYDLSLEMLRAQGLNIIFFNGKYYFESALQDFKDSTFCIVDIESNGSKPDLYQVIEIGAVKWRNGEIIDTFESFVKCSEIREHITRLTGITIEDTLHAPPLKDVMEKFRIFLGTDIFVAHDVKFDYKFISAMMSRVGLGELKNRTLCSIDLAERSFSSFRYGLSYLNDDLDLYTEATHHRALSDALTTTKLFEYSLSKLKSKA
jgi:DNA polymerase III subunit epsilon